MLLILRDGILHQPPAASLKNRFHYVRSVCMTGYRSIKTEKLNDRHILVKEFLSSTILKKKLNDPHILLKE